MKPKVAEMVHYFNPKLMQRIGYTEGYGGRGVGPYAALVTNDIGNGLTLLVYLPGVSPMEFREVPHKEEDHAQDGGYWDWKSPLEKARAAKAA